MDSERWEQIKTLFLAALDRDGAERDAFLDDIAADDPALRREIEDLLSGHERSQGLLLEHRFLTEGTGALPNPDALVGMRIGRYQMQELLGQGGMGAVYRAERDGDFEQQVALKLIRPGLHTAEVVARFRVERRILARLQHPNIARLYDGGLTEDGLPYFVMEYVAGTPITTFCDQHRLPIAERLRLFQTVCQTVQFAHQNLVVHRDLKPSNILVTDEGTVKLLDFGIAKLLDPVGSGASVLQTRPELRVMTPEYAAPEQVRGAAITTATDVYALGVLLYELLTGHRPYRLPERRRAEAERIICEEEPTRPSTAIAEVETITRADGTTETLTPELVSAARATQATRLRRTLQGDLDTVVMMALRKEPTRRYASAEQLGEDLRRYLDGHPVIARSDTLAYRAAKFVRRNRVGVSIATAFLLLLVGFSTMMVAQARRVAQERDKAEQVATFLADVFAAADPAAAQGDTLTALDLLERGTARIETELADQPAIQADLLDVMSRAYFGQGAYDRAEVLARRALAVRNALDLPSVPVSQTRLAEALEAQSRFPEADSLHRTIVASHRERGQVSKLIEALERRGRLLITSLSPPDSVEAVFEEALALRLQHYGTDDPGRGRLLFQYAGAYHVTGEYARAEALFREALRVQRRHPGDPATTAENLYQLGLLLRIRRQHVEADSLLREAAAIRERIYGRDHPETAEVLNIRAGNLVALGRFEEAEALLREALSAFEQHDERTSKGYHSALRGLRYLLSEAGRYEEAVAVSSEVVALTDSVYGAGSRGYATNLSHHAQALLNAGRPAEALEAYRRALPLIVTTLGAENAFYGVTLGEAGRAAEALNQPAEAEALYEQAYAILRNKLGPDSYSRSRVALALGRHYAARGDHAGALPLFEDAARVRVADDDHSGVLAARAEYALGHSLLTLGRPAEAEPHLHAAHQQLQRLLGKDHAETTQAHQALVASRRETQSR